VSASTSIVSHGRACLRGFFESLIPAGWRPDTSSSRGVGSLTPFGAAVRTFAFADGRRKFVEATLTARLFHRVGRAAILALFLASPPALAGPPFVTDDPEPVDYQHFEFFAFSSGMRMRGNTDSDTPAVEFDYGIVPNGRVAFIAPMTFDRAAGEPFNWGFGDADLEFKYRFVKQDKNGWRPSIGVVPTVFLPSGDFRRGLGDGVARAFLPMWFQKDFGDWTTYGGGGYTFSRGRGNKNFWYVGWVLQRKITDKLAIGAEVFHQSADKLANKDQTGFNVGAIYDFTENYHLLFSMGRGIQHARETNELSWYVALLVTGGGAKSERTTNSTISPATFDWTGFYLGAACGHVRQRAVESDMIGDVGPFYSSYLLKGPFGGPFSGFNWKRGPILLGVEADVEAAHATGGQLPFLAGMTQRHDVRGSARGRLGVAFDRTLLYATGGVALANFFPFALGESFNQARPGWTAGGGVEYALAENWSGRIEYRHSDLGSTLYESSNFDGNSYRIRMKDDAVRVGVAYHFDFAEPKPSPRDHDAPR